MRKRTRVTALAGTALAVASFLPAAPALAAGMTWTVTSGGNYPLSGVNGPELQDVTAHSHILCTATGSVALNFKTGTGLGSILGHVNPVSFPGSACDGSALTASGLPWPVKAISYNGDTFGKIEHIHLTLSGACSAVLDGTSDTADDGWQKFAYTNPAETGGAGDLATIDSPGSNLRVYDASGCTAIHDGDRVSFRITMNVARSKDASPTITSP